ncbi:MAG TPA: TIGR02594 family protein [Bradyrhizobium sp.]|nr:TIGR02594 family protein [Bradyrhizobium sp.]
MVMSVSPASAKSRHRISRHGHPHYAHRHVVRRHFAYRHFRHERLRHERRIARRSRWEPRHAQRRAAGFANARLVSGSAVASSGFSGGFGLLKVVADARRYIGSGNPTGLPSLWCARFMNMVLHQAGYRGTGSDAARSFASYGRRVSGPRVGAIAVMARRGGGHVGIVSGIDARGNPIVISGNYGHRVAEASISRSRIYAYVVPTG